MRFSVALFIVTLPLCAQQAKQSRGTLAVTPQQLFAAIRSEDVVAVKAFLAKGANANATAKYGITPLLLAVRKGNSELVTLLLSSGAKADTEARIPNNEVFEGVTPDPTVVFAVTPLFVASYMGKAEIVDSLVKKGAVVDQRSTFPRRGLTPLVAAAFGGHDAVGEILLAKGADAGFRFDTGPDGQGNPVYISVRQVAASQGHHSFEKLIEDAPAGTRTASVREAEGNPLISPGVSELMRRVNIAGGIVNTNENVKLTLSILDAFASKQGENADSTAK